MSRMFFFFSMSKDEVNARIAGLGLASVCSASTTVLAEGVAGVASVLTIDVRPEKNTLTRRGSRLSFAECTVRAQCTGM